MLQISKSAGRAVSWSRQWHDISEEEHRRTNTLPQRHPSIAECDAMLDAAHTMTIQIRLIKDIIMQHEETLQADRRMREQVNRAPYDEESMYGEDIKHGFESKRRRGVGDLIKPSC